MKYNKYIVMAIVMMISSCQVKDIEIKNSIELPSQFKYMQPYLVDNNLEYLNNWWEQWNDPQLTNLISKGLAKNYDLAIARQQINQARAIRKLTQADLFPIIGFTANWNKIDDIEIKHNINTGNLPIPNQFDINTKTSSYGIVANWEMDIFGKKRKIGDASSYALLAEQDRSNGVRVLVTGEIAEQYFSAILIKQQQNLIEKTIKTLSEMERYTMGRFRAGQTDMSSIYEIRTNLNNLRSKVPALQAQYNLLEQNIAVLVGEIPQNFHLTINNNSLNKTPKLPNATVPSDILQRRPDILARANAVKAYMAKSKSARADLLPKFYLNFAWLNGRIELGDLPTSNLNGSLFNAGVSLPIFTAGRIRSNIEIADSKLQQSVLEYEKNLLVALQEIDGAYQMSTLLDKSLVNLYGAEKNAKAVVYSRYHLFKNGSLTYQDALKAELEQYKVTQQKLQMQFNLANSKIKLYQALGGGWDFIKENNQNILNK